MSWADGILYTILDLFQRIDDKGKQISVPNWDTKSLLEILLGINKDELPEGVFEPFHVPLKNAYMADKILYVSYLPINLFISRIVQINLLTL